MKSSDYELFKSQYVELKTHHKETFEQKVFAEHVVFNGRKVNITDRTTFETVH